MMWGYGWGGMSLWMIIVSLFWLAVLGVLIWSLVRWLGSRGQALSTPTQPPVGSGPTALDILQQRYARGEIDTTTFEQMRERLETGITSVSQARGAREQSAL